MHDGDLDDRRRNSTRARFRSGIPGKPDADQLIESDVRIRMVGANPHPPVEGLEPLPGRVNYLIGGRQVKWHTRHSDIRAREDSRRVSGRRRGPLRSRRESRIRHRGGAGGGHFKDQTRGRRRCEDSRSTRSGNLQIVTAAGVVVMHKPNIYQHDADGNRTPVDGAFVLAKDGTIEAGIRGATSDFSSRSTTIRASW